MNMTRRTSWFSLAACGVQSAPLRFPKDPKTPGWHRSVVLLNMPEVTRRRGFRSLVWRKNSPKIAASKHVDVRPVDVKWKKMQ